MNSNTWRSNVSNSRLATALVAGVVATHVATITGYWYRIIGFPNLDWPRFNGMLLFPEGSDVTKFVSGAIFHSFTGISLSLIYAYLIHPMLPGPNTTRGNIVKALIWGGFLAVVSALIWVPSLFPAFNPGFFSSNLGWKTVVGIFIWHAIYGLHLGSLYNPLSDEKR